MYCGVLPVALLCSSMSSNSFPAGAASTGGEWGGEIIFNDNPGINGKAYTQKIEVSRLRKLLGRELKVESVAIFQNALKSDSAYGFFDNATAHKFVVIQTSGGFLSIEKNTAGIIIQTDEDRNKVIYRIDGQKRAENFGFKIKEEKKLVFARPKYLWDLLEDVNLENELKNGYNVLNRNCRHFAELIYETASKKQK